MSSDGMKPFVLKILDDVNAELRLTLDGIDLQQALWRPSPQSNSVAWLAWHIARLQDARAASLAASEQLWISEGWHQRFGLPADPSDHGRGHTDEQVDAVRPESIDALRGYANASHDFLRAEIDQLDDLDAITQLGGDSGDTTVRDLVFRAVHGGLAHVGQLMYVRGFFENRHWFPR